MRTKNDVGIDNKMQQLKWYCGVRGIRNWEFQSTRRVWGGDLSSPVGSRSN